MILDLTLLLVYKRLFLNLRNRQGDFRYYKRGNANYMKLF